MKILAAVQECSGLRVLVERHWAVPPTHGWTERVWLNPPEAGLPVEEAERLIEEQGIVVRGRTTC